MTETTSQPLEYAPADRAAEGTPLGWAAYLGASWTWCIGMFLPVLLIRDFGPWAWVIFAIPNVVGAGAMGWVMRSSEMSRRYTIDHASACRLFSYVTIAFQLFFAVWNLPHMMGPVGWVFVAVIIQSAFTPLTRLRWLRWGGAAALIFSTVAAAWLLSDQALAWPPPSVRMSVGQAVGLSVVCLAGFLACPYLDLTFHRARISTSDADAKFAFGVGFGALFASMIVLTFFYALPLMKAQADNGIGRLNPAAWALALHWTVQIAITVHMHSAELVRQAEVRDDPAAMRVGLGAWLAIGFAAGLAAVFGMEHVVMFRSFSLGEVGYRTFMACYGLLFPVYVLLAIGRPRVSWVTWAVITLAALPFFWLAFIENRMPWATAGVAVIVVGALIGRRFTSATPSAMPLTSE